MSLRSQLEAILPTILPDHPKEAIKGPELIRLVKVMLDGDYSDASLRYHFSCMASEPHPIIAKVDRGQGYYKVVNKSKSLSESRGLLPLFSEQELPANHEELQSRALALSVRSYDTTGRGVFVFAPESADGGRSWESPDMMVVDWPEGDWEGEALVFDRVAVERRRLVGAPMVALRSVCLAYMPRGERYRQSFFRALACSAMAQSGYLLIVGDMPQDVTCNALRDLAAEFGIGVECMVVSEERLNEMPSAEEIFRASGEQCDVLLSGLEPVEIAAAKMRPRISEMGKVSSGEYGALFNWLSRCLSKGRVDEYEFRVSSY